MTSIYEKEVVMLKGYFDNDTLTVDEIIKYNKRLIAVQAALEIVKASAESASNAAGGSMYNDLSIATQYLGPLADAIQDALEPKNA